MKSILYVGATLMIGAGIYGFVDYKKANQNKEFRSLYNEAHEKEPAAKTKPVVGKEPGIKPMPQNESISPAEKKQAPLANKGTENTAGKKIKKRKKVNYKAFSRAPMTEFTLEVPEVVR